MRWSTSGESLKEPRHFFGALYKELVAVEVEAFLVVDLGAGLHAEHHVVRVGVFTAEIMRVVGGDKGNIQFAFQAEERCVNLLFVLQALILNFEKEIALAEDVLVLLRGDALAFS